MLTFGCTMKTSRYESENGVVRKKKRIKRDVDRKQV
jgi:hypothetical protein